MTAPATTEALKREIGVGSLAMAIVNFVIGSGIFVLPAIVAEGLGATAIVAYIGCGALIILLALCFADAGSKVSNSGGGYIYIEEAFGKYSGFLALSIYVVGAGVASDAAIANAMADTLKVFFPELSVDTNRIIFMFIIFGALGWLNISSVKNGVRFAVVAGALKLFALILLVIVTIPHVAKENLTWVVKPTAANIGPAILLLFFAFQGFEAPLSNGGEIKNPGRTVPRGIFLGVAIILLLYISIQLITQGTLGDNITKDKSAPLSAVAGIALGRPGAVFIILVTIVAILGSISGGVLSIPRMLFAGGRDGVLPKQLAKTHPRFATPHVAIIAYVAADFILAISGGFRQLALLASAASLLLYLGVALACIKLKRGQNSRIPGGKAVPIISTAAIIWLLANLSIPELITIGLSLALFSLIYLFKLYIGA